MTTMLTASRWLYTTLAADATIHGIVADRIYVDQDTTQTAPASAYPLIELTQMSNMVVRGVGTDNIMWDEIWLVKGISTKSAPTELEPLLNQVRTALHAAAGSTVTSGSVSGTMIACTEERVIQYSEVDNGIPYYHLGIEFRIYTQ